MRFGFGPNNEHVRNWGIRDPHLRPVKDIAALDLFGGGFHTSGVRTCIGLGQTKTANPLARRQFWQVFLALFFRTVGINRIHHQRTLHRHHRTIATVNALHFARHQTIGDVTRTNPTVFLWDSGPEKAHFSHFGKDRWISLFVFVGSHHTRRQLFVAIGTRCIPHHALVFFQLAFNQKRVFPVERTQFRFGLWCQILGHGLSFRPPRFEAQNIYFRCRPTCPTLLQRQGYGQETSLRRENFFTFYCAEY
mmetsp:Transcript_23358/g.40746  ORF Transcript_23358/g.40746 Transcript_23358/m.40746 type:complete len:249 (+) Transcript_23358:170-916(+)